MPKPLTDLTDAELERAHDRTWRRHYEVTKEKSRRKMIERYGAENPELNAYTVELAIDYGSVTVKAKNPEEAEQIARDEIYWMTDNYDQIDFDEGPGLVVDRVELVQEAEPTG
jgi:hypothetical protein